MYIDLIKIFDIVRDYSPSITTHVVYDKNCNIGLELYWNEADKKTVVKVFFYQINLIDDAYILEFPNGYEIKVDSNVKFILENVTLDDFVFCSQIYDVNLITKNCIINGVLIEYNETSII